MARGDEKKTAKKKERLSQTARLRRITTAQQKTLREVIKTLEAAKAQIEKNQGVVSVLLKSTRLAFVEGYDRGVLGTEFNTKGKPTPEGLAAWETSLVRRSIFDFFGWKEDEEAPS